nr:unnamed protein product [Callosobruchus analis]
MYMARRKILPKLPKNQEDVFNKEVVIDFEYGIHKSVCTIWASAKIIGCRFHLSQAWYRKILQLGLSEEYKNSVNNAHFPPAIWASSTNFINRTTNGCESFHSKFNECFYSPHPNVFNFANILLEFQTLIYVKIKTANLFVKKETKTTKEKREYINSQIYQYPNIKISRYTYVKLVSFKNLLS